MSNRTRAARPLASAIGVALSLTLLAPAGLSPATAAPDSAQVQSVPSFSDVPSHRVFYTEISWMSANGISNGWTLRDGTREYRPAQNVLRDQMAAFMYRLAGSPEYTPPAVSPFTDVRPGQAFYKEINWLAENGISNGWTLKDGTRQFRPGQPVLRDQMAAFMYRLAGSPAYTAPASSRFTDSRQGLAFYKEISWLSENGISNGWAASGGTRIYGPGRSVLRDQMAAFMYRLDAGGHLDHHQAGQPLKVSGIAAAPGEVGSPVNWAFTATGGTKPYAYSRVAGTLPAGVTLDPASGKLTGTPTRAGDYELSVKVVDAGGKTATATAVLVVKERNLSQKAQLTAKSLDTNYRTTAVVKNDGTVWEWTPNQSLDGALTPTKREGISNVTQTVAGTETTYALRSDGTVWGWGSNMDGALANPDADNYETVPVRVGGLTDVVQIASAGRANFALKSDGTVWSWGRNHDGLLGTGHWDDYLVSTKPVRVPNIYNIPIASLEVSEESAYAIARDGSVWSWGYNGYGQLGHGNTDSSDSPRLVRGLTGVRSVAGGPNSAYAIKTDDTVWYMGQKNCATQPSGAPVYSSTAQRLTGLNSVKSMAVGACSSFAVKADGTVWVSGESRNRADLGTGTWYEPNFVQVMGLPSTASVTTTAGPPYDNTKAAVYATATDGGVWGWGFMGPYHSRDGGDGLIYTPTRITH